MVRTIGVINYINDSGAHEYSKPALCYYEYMSPNNTNALDIIIDPSGFISAINGIIKLNSIYTIKLYNFSTLDSLNINYSDPNSVDITWDNTLKTLVITNNTSADINSVTNSLPFPTTYGASSSVSKIYAFTISTVTTTANIIYPAIVYPTTAGGIIATTASITLLIDTSATTFPTGISYNPTTKLLTIANLSSGGTTLNPIVIPNYTAITFGNFNYAITNNTINPYMKRVWIDIINVFNVIKNNNLLFNYKITNNTGSQPTLSIISYEDSTYDASATTNSLGSFHNKYLNGIMVNFKKITDRTTYDVSDSNAIITSMSNLADINTKISKSSVVIKQNYSQFQSENSKVLSTNIIEKTIIAVLIVVIFTAIYLPLSKMDRNNTITISGVIFIIVVILYVIIQILISSRYDTIDAFTLPSINIKTNVNSIILNLQNNLYNERTKISQGVILPSLKKEEGYFKQKSDTFDVYKSRTYSDLQIERITKKRNVAKMSFMLEVSVIISLSLLLFIVKPEWIKIILAIAMVLFILSLFIMFVRITNVVRTNSKNIYWQRPDPALEQLKYTNNQLI